MSIVFWKKVEKIFNIFCWGKIYGILTKNQSFGNMWEYNEKWMENIISAWQKGKKGLQYFCKTVHIIIIRKEKIVSKRLTEREKRWIERTVSNNRNYKLFLYNRFFLFLLLVLAQLGGYVALWYLFAYHSAAGVVVQFATSILAWIVVLRLINKYDKPSLKLNWILLILIC